MFYNLAINLIGYTDIMPTSNTSYLDHLLNMWQNENQIASNIVFKHLAPATQPVFEPFPNSLNPILQKALHTIGIDLLYTHQFQSWNIVKAGENLGVVTGTASGKNALLQSPGAGRSPARSSKLCALYLSHTKALAQDQYQNLVTLNQKIKLFSSETNLLPAIYDGDTSPRSRSEIRSTSRLILTNPDMLHIGILPHHTLWARFLQNLRFVVLDEMHVYRGVFGSNIGNVIRRLKRVLRFYGSDPQFIPHLCNNCKPQTTRGKAD